LKVAALFRPLAERERQTSLLPDEVTKTFTEVGAEETSKKVREGLPPLKYLSRVDRTISTGIREKTPRSTCLSGASYVPLKKGKFLEARRLVQRFWLIAPKPVLNYQKETQC
jgi:hypothetical protein